MTAAALGFAFASALMAGWASPALAGEGDDIRIGIFGDVHGDVPALDLALNKMREMKVTHVIGMGDFVEFGGAEQLERMVSRIAPLTGVSAENTYLLPGNWEHTTQPQSGMSAADANAVLSRYGRLVVDAYDSYGIIEIQGIRIMAAHYPQHSIPETLIPPARFLRRLPEQVFILDTIARETPVPADVTFEVFGHTHIRAHYHEPRSGKLVVNPGPLTQRKSPTEPRSITVFSASEGAFSFVDLDSGAVQRVQLPNPCGNALEKGL